MNLDELRSFLDATNVSEKECMKRLQEARAWMTSPGHDKLQTTDVIDLYNASRKCAMHDTNKQVAYQIRSLACMLLKRLVGPSISESLDLLRCFARTGHVLRGASVSSHVIASPEVCFSEAIAIYRSMGLNHLSKTKSGVELEEICEDIWDAFEGHLSCITSVADMVQDIHDLRMFMPYLPQNTTKFVKLVMNLAESHRLRDARDAEATLLGIALELIETLDNIKKKSSLRRTALVCLVDVYIDMEMLDRAETCWTLLMSPETPQGLQSGVKLHLKSRAFPRALSLVEQLQEHDNYELACEATRMYSATVGYHDGTVFPLWETLKVNFPANAIQIDMELATELAFSEHQHLREKSCSITARLAEQWPQFAPDQLSQLKKVIHDASCNATNYDLSEELFRWTEVALVISRTPAERVVCKRIMSLAKLRLGDFAMALQLATEALNEEMSKKSIFACFRVLVSCDDASSSATSVEETLVRLIECDDFDIYDMVAFGREAHQAKNHASVLQVCETLAKLLSERICATNELPQLEVGVLYQNMAQLNNSLCEGDERQPISKFMTYLDDLLALAERIEPSQVEKSFGPPEVLEWFFGVCHNIGVNTQNWRCFKQAAQVAATATKLFPTTKLQGRDEKCWVAAICLRMKAIDTLSNEDLVEVESLLARQLSQDKTHTSKIQDYLATSMFIVKIKTDDFRTTDFLECYTAKLEQTSMKYRELGDYVFTTSTNSTTKASTIALRSISSHLYKFSLQLELQQKHVESRAVLYALKKLVALAQSKEEGCEWLEHVVQISSTIDIVLLDDDIEWFMAKAWNFGVSCFRNQELKSAQGFMSMAFKLLGMSTSRTLGKAYHDTLQSQYAQLLTLMQEQHQHE
ncbi:hypothetical protein H257_14493 [Aphanomyces astaci]|uniref:Protein ZIP4 homolog n=1 Tax=Aphanomyces astaci TaxID=112090 RepID=W4FTA6_APHAT|nr:hypothetical protein H257_14493 [Aphanomyces astaci]ETV69893.1 hypothetical protein H257_14493 [Aphanomyces astaci]|eukprot:XP_009840631.1 hypothetical protein H257_14493 [Aphanomyces astaci]